VDRQGRKGQRCLVLARGKMNSYLVKFEDGYTMVTSRNALKLANSDLFPIGNTTRPPDSMANSSEFLSAS
jgi:hypothetical protein